MDRLDALASYVASELDAILWALELGNYGDAKDLTRGLRDAIRDRNVCPEALRPGWVIPWRRPIPERRGE